MIYATFNVVSVEPPTVVITNASIPTLLISGCVILHQSIIQYSSSLVSICVSVQLTSNGFQFTILKMPSDYEIPRSPIRMESSKVSGEKHEMEFMPISPTEISLSIFLCSLRHGRATACILFTTVCVSVVGVFFRCKQAALRDSKA